ncbi:RNA polymerase II-associated protein 3 [Sorochytrium milnesiophthora]
MDPAPLTVLPSPPMASVEFERDMKLMTDATELQYQSLKSIALPNLPKIITFLDVSQLGNVLCIVHRSYFGPEDPKLIFNTLNQMSKCVRFSVARKLLERHEAQST